MKRVQSLLTVPLLLVLLWDALLFGLYMWMRNEESANAKELAMVQLQTIHANIINTRNWVASQGGVWLPQTPNMQPNPRIPANARQAETTTGAKIVKLNPAGVIRKISEFSNDPYLQFRASSLHPMYEGNRADTWEAEALRAAEQHKNEAQSSFTLQDGRFRYMTALLAQPSCLSCHTTNKVNDVLGGLSVSLVADSILRYSDKRLSDMAVTFLLVGFLGSVGIGSASFQLSLRRREAESASRSKSEFLASMSHEIRTPMNGILGLCYLLQKTTISPEQRRLLDKIEISGKTLLRILNDILDFSKVEAGKMQLERTPFRIDTTLDSVMALVAPEADAKLLPVVLEMAPNVPSMVEGDPLRLSQILLNLTCNAIKFTTEGEVRLRVSAQEIGPDRVNMRFEVSDTGIGIPERMLSKLFTSFTQVDSSTARQHGGTGLGLAICKGLVHMMGGSIGVRSVEGQGSTFFFTLPFSVAEDQDEQVSVDAEPCYDTLNGCRILLVEDNAINQVVAAEILHSFGAEVETVADGQECLDKMAESTFDIVLMDIQMPRMDGLTATRHLRQTPRFDAVPIIAMTANAMPEDVAASLKAGMQAHVSKPFMPHELLATLQQWRNWKTAC